jgi:carbonic anhydrase
LTLVPNLSSPFRHSAGWVLTLGVIVCMSWPAIRADEPAKARESLGRLKAGNDRFVKNASTPVSLSPVTRQALTKGQAPFATVLSCADSRVPPEYILNTGLGELFVIRTAGEVIDRSLLASLEYGAEHLHTPLLVVMGHESCGAVKAAVEGAAVDGPNLDYLVKAIKAATKHTPSEQQELRTAILANVEQVINDAMAGSAILRHAVESGSLQIVGAYYELASGRVIFSEPVSSTTAASSK